MITRIRASGFRSLRNVDVPLGRFHVLVGPNGSGKSTFLDVVPFLAEFVERGLADAVGERTFSFFDLLWRREARSLLLGVELVITGGARASYWLVLHADPDRGLPTIFAEHLNIASGGGEDPGRVVMDRQNGRAAWLSGAADAPLRVLASPGRSALNAIPEGFQEAAAFAEVLSSSVRRMDLRPEALASPSPWSHREENHLQGGSLPWWVERLREQPDSFAEWIGHLRTAVPDLQDVRPIRRDEDRSQYLMFRFAGGIEAPSWMVSGGTLRLCALTLPAALRDTGSWLVEEPENGIHPQALETAMHSLRSIYEGQSLVTTHSSLLVGMLKPSDLLCFSRSAEGGTVIVPGDRHAWLQDWQRGDDLSLLFASGAFDGEP